MSDYRSKLLVASPALGDPNFRQAVVLILHGSDEETFGLILNRESDKRISEIWETIFGHPCEARHRLYVGGPVFGPLIALHTDKSLADAEVLPGLYFSTQKEAIEALVENEYQPLRLFVGGSGWGRNQLSGEIEQGAWFLLPGSIGDVFEDPTEIWKKALVRAGRGFLSSMLHRKEIDEDPTLN